MFDNVSDIARQAKPMYAVGHLALGYLAGRAGGRVLKVKANVPLLFLLSVLPDVDLLVPGFRHGGPTHSLILSFLLFTPAFLYYGRQSIPYFLALAQHSLVGDLLIGEIEVLWPLTSRRYGLGIKIWNPLNIFLEYGLFLVSFASMLASKDLLVLLSRHKSNLLLSVPLATLLLPTLLRFPLYVPLALLAPNLVYVGVFTLAIALDLKDLLL